ncbi:MAG TPA: ATP-binding cassette domain-containing protein [Rhizomicrobium sp.]|jgi:molybdate transport system ATP-binding protein|nr:ATP-binding cassette domain-containing protein [Rhizomicrobium sp.]
MTLTAEIQLTLGTFRLAASFTAPGDGITVLFGPSGSGKSSLLSVLAGLSRPDHGHIRLGSHNLDGVPAHRRGIGLVFQDARLFPHLSVRQNIAYAWKRAPEQKRPAIEAVTKFFDIVAQLDRPVANLSGGEKSRVALARAVAAAPDFLLLDEPFAALDGARRRAFIQVLAQMHDSYHLPMLVVTHDIDDAAALASHLVALKDGQVVAQGVFAEASRTSQFQALLDGRDTGVAMPAAALRSTHDTIGAGRSLWLRADQVLLMAEEPRAVSARNVLAGEVVAVTVESRDSRLVEVMTDIGTVLSRITPEAVQELGLVPGKKAWALIKAHAI